jgi:hypothetical protein
MKRIILSAVALLGLCLSSAPAVFAAAPDDRFRDSWDFVDDVTICGFDVTAHFTGHIVGLVKPDPGSLDTLQFGSFIQNTFTSADGRQLLETVAETSHDLVVRTDGERIYDTYSVTGTLVLKDGNHHTLDQRAGRIIYTDVYNLNGTPDDFSDDYLESFTIDFVAGPHPFAEGGIFCDAVDQAFG